MFETGKKKIKVVDLLAPYAKAGKVGCRRDGVGDVIRKGSDTKTWQRSKEDWSAFDGVARAPRSLAKDPWLEMKESGVIDTTELVFADERAPRAARHAPSTVGPDHGEYPREG